MANADEELTVAQRLGRALDRGLLPAGGPAEAAERLIERLERPARIALLGLPGSGKSSILNLLVGATVVPETLRLPTIVVQHGDTARMMCTLTDGSTKILAGSNLAEVLPLAPALVTLEMDLAALKVISLLEVSAGPMEAEQKRAASWASKRADIVIWCTTSYLPKEQVVWESLPDAVKDNSFMFLTKVDLLGSRQSASAMHDRVELRAGEEFRQILSISAKEARAAMPPGGPVNRDLFRDSGATAVISAIKTRVQSGRRADMDTAELLLARHVEASELVARRFAEPGEVADGPWTPPPETEEPAIEPVDGVDPLPEAAETADVAAADEEGLAEADPEETAEQELATEPEPVLEDEPEPETEPVPDDEPEPDVADEQEIIEPTVVEPQPEQPETRRRFADRIKRVAGDAESATPLVPLRSTWKSKAELEAGPEPEPERVAKPPEPTRRPRPTSQPTSDDGDLARILANISTTPDPVAEDLAPSRPRPPRAVTPRPERTPDVPAPDSPETAPQGEEDDASPAERRKVFGAARVPPAGLTRGTPLPDLSSLRARPEEMSQPDADEGQTQDLDDAETDEADDFATDFAAVTEPDAVVEPEAEPAPLVEVTSRPAAPVERPRLFGRDPRPAEPTPPPREELRPRSVPVQRLPASARAAAPSPAAPTAPALDQAQFSPRAIMMRDRPAETEQPVARRERPRIAARAVPANVAPAAPSPEIGLDGGLAAEAIALIKGRAAELEREIDSESKVPVDLVLDHTRETSEQVMAVVSRGRSEGMRRINSDVGEVLDLIMLMQLEKGHAPADDALTLLLQLRRELETLSAV